MSVPENIKTDLVGEVIEPGHLIAFGRSGDGSKDMELGIVSMITIGKNNTGRLYLFSIQNKVERIGTSYQYKIVSRESKQLGTWTKLSSDRIQQHIIIIKNPYFAIDNPSIARELDVADMAVDAGFLPKGYQLGTPISDIKDDGDIS